MAATPDRRHLDFDFFNPQFYGRRTALTLRYRDLSDGRRGEWRFGFALSSRPPRHMRSEIYVKRLGNGCSGFATTRSSTACAITCSARE